MRNAADLPGARSCKIGTMPALVQVHGRDRLEVGRVVRIKEQPGGKWSTVLVRQINDDGYFQADRH